MQVITDTVFLMLIYTALFWACVKIHSRYQRRVSDYYDAFYKIGATPGLIERKKRAMVSAFFGLVLIALAAAGTAAFYLLYIVEPSNPKP